MAYDYFYGTSESQFAFFRVPTLLLNDDKYKDLSLEAVVLYGLLVDRMSLSKKNGWIDEKGRVFIIFTIKEIEEKLRCKHDKAIKILSQLCDKADLVEKKKQGLGRPDILYVKNFMTGITSIPKVQEDSKPDIKVQKEQNEDSIKTVAEERTTISNTVKPNKQSFQEKLSTLQFQPTEKTDVKKSDFKIAEVGKTDTNQNNNNHNYIMYHNHLIDLNNINTIEPDWEPQYTHKEVLDMVRENVHYDYFIDNPRFKLDMVDELIGLMVDTIVHTERNKIRINGGIYSGNVVRSVFLKLNQDHFIYVLNCLKNNSTEVYNIRSYMMTSLYNSYFSFHNYLNAKINYDLKDILAG